MKRTNLKQELEQTQETIRGLKEELDATHDEFQKTNSELLQLTSELEDRVAERTRALRESQETLKKHRHHLQELVRERTAELRNLNEELKGRLSELRASEERFRSLGVTIPDVVYRTDTNGEFTFINDAIRRLGYAPKELIGTHFNEMILPADVEAVSRSIVLPKYAGRLTGDDSAPKLFDERRTGKRRTKDLELRVAVKDCNPLKHGFVDPFDNGFIVVEINSSGMYEVNLNTKAEVFVGTIGVIRDISDRKEMEEDLRKARDNLEMKVKRRTAELQSTNDALNAEVSKRTRIQERLEKALDELKQSHAQLIEAEKMGALGTLTAGMAHELNNPMMGMLNFIQYCLKHTPEDDKRHTVLRDAERETNRCIDIVRNLLTFSRIEQEDEEVYVKESCAVIFDRVFQLLSYRIDKDSVSITQHVAEGTSEIWVKASNMQQVFLNLISNALDALNGIRKKEIDVDICPEGEFVRVTVADNGCGIAPENVPKIFDPFFTTKRPGKGTGLGLSVSQSIVNAHGGEIRCVSEVGVGTKFKVLLPIERKT